MSLADKTLRPGQVNDLTMLIQNKRFGLFSDPGVGKTPPACVYFWWLWSEKKERTIWAMPSWIRKKNKRELLDWTDFKEEDVLIWEGEIIYGEPKVIITTFARLRRSWRQLLARFPDINCVAGDETQLAWKGVESDTVKQLNLLMEKVERFVPMTGSFIAGRLDTAYPVINLIEPRYYTSHENFLFLHADYDDWGKIRGWTNHAKLGEIIMRHCTSRSFKEEYGEAKFVIIPETVQMAPTQRAKFDEFFNAAILELEDRFLDASTNPGVHAIRCRQIMAHPENITLPIAYDDEGEPIAWQTYDLVKGEENAKDQALRVHLDYHQRTGEPLVIFGTLIPEMQRIAQMCRDMGLRTGEVHSGRSSKDCQTDLDEFEARELDVIVVSPTKAGAGLNWPFVDHMIFASIDYQDDHFIQALFRALRGVRQTALRVTVLEYENSLDQRMQAIVERKSRDANRVDPGKIVISFKLSQMT